MPAPKTIACPKCSTPLRVRSLDAVSTADECPECGTLLKAAAERKKAEGDPVHPALKKPEKRLQPKAVAADTAGEGEFRLSPATIAAISTGVVALIVIAGLSWGTVGPEPEGWVPGSDGEPIAPVPAKATSGEEEPSEPGELIAGTGAESKPMPAGESETVEPNPGDRPGQSEVNSKPEEEPPETLGSEAAGPKVVTAEGPGDLEWVKQISGTDGGNSAPSEARPGTPVTPPLPKPVPVEERLAFSIEKFDLSQPVTLKSLLETVEIMAEIQIEVDEAIPAATFERRFAFSLEKTSPRGILDEAAKQAGLSVTLKHGRVMLENVAK